MRFALNAGFLLFSMTLSGIGTPRLTTSSFEVKPPAPAGAETVAPSRMTEAPEAAASDARRRYHFMVWNFTTQTINVHLASSLAGCSSDINGIAPGHAFERGAYHDKWDRGKICAGACWTAIEAYDASGHHVVHVTPSAKLPKIFNAENATGVSGGAIAVLIAEGPLAAAASVAIAAGISSVESVMADGGPCHGADIGIWRSANGSWKAAQRFTNDYQVWQNLMANK